MMKSPRKTFLGRGSGGFSLAEIVVVAGILGILAVVVGTGLSRALDQQALNSDVEQVISAIQRARGFTLASRDPAAFGEGRRYGVYFDMAADPDAYVIFYGSNTEGYSAAREVERVELKFSSIDSVVIQCSGCPPDDNAIIFKRLTGDVLAKKGAAFPFVSPFATITLKSNRTSLSRQIKVYPVGTIETQ